MPAHQPAIEAPDRIIRVKFLSSVSERKLKRQLPGDRAMWGRCQFIFDPDERQYDWLVVYDDLPSAKTGGSYNEEVLACPKRQTLLVTTEPSSIKAYGRDFTAQFGSVLTSQPEWALPHHDRIFTQPALCWFYGIGRHHEFNYDQMAESPPGPKVKNLSTVCSDKKQRHTLHNKRYRFTQSLKEKIPEMDIYGHGVKRMDDKAEAITPYRYHVAIENYLGQHHWTEKLADVFLGGALPLYYGCPNVSEYFPEGSFIPIDINDVESASQTIKRAIQNNEYEKRLPAIKEARRLILDEYNMFSVLSKEIECRHLLDSSPPVKQNIILSRRTLRKKDPKAALRNLYDKIRLRIIHLFLNG